MLVPFTRYYR